MDKHILICVHITNRVKEVPRVQLTYTEFGCNIKTRLGLHEVSEDYCSPAGVHVLEMTGEERLIDEMVGKLQAIEGVEVQKVVFSHP